MAVRVAPGRTCDPKPRGLADRLIHCESRTFGRNFEQNPARLAKVNRMKVKTIDHRRNAQTEILDLLSPFQLLLLIGTAKCDVMHGAGGINSELAVGVLDQIDRPA